YGCLDLRFAHRVRAPDGRNVARAPRARGVEPHPPGLPPGTDGTAADPSGRLQCVKTRARNSLCRCACACRGLRHGWGIQSMLTGALEHCASSSAARNRRISRRFAFFRRARAGILRWMTGSSNSLIWLASGSPRRTALLAQLGVAHRVRPVAVDERVRPGEAPRAYVQRLALEKAEALWARLPAAARLPVLGADTTVTVAGEILAKPSGFPECERMLRRLSGRTHEVCRAVALRDAQGADVRLSVSTVTFRVLQPEEIAAYWASGEPRDKAGGYAVQGLGALFIEHIAGSYSGIV